MRTLTVAEIGQVHGANGFTDWLGEVWEEVKNIFGSKDEADDFTEEMDDLYESVINGARDRVCVRDAQHHASRDTHGIRHTRSGQGRAMGDGVFRRVEQVAGSNR